ncbi:hypothetical protein [Paramagnetospirillum marisnigri]|nr:hypothetical protein [Paramagnetospirillum marisnigri]
MSPRLLSLSIFRSEFGPSRSQTYIMLARGEIEAVKVGSRTYITRESAERWAAGLAKFSSRSTLATKAL